MKNLNPNQSLTKED